MINKVRQEVFSWWLRQRVLPMVVAMLLAVEILKLTL